MGDFFRLDGLRLWPAVRGGFRCVQATVRILCRHETPPSTWNSWLNGTIIAAHGWQSKTGYCSEIGHTFMSRVQRSLL